mgnify:CR=1 FL=1
MRLTVCSDLHFDHYGAKTWDIIKSFSVSDTIIIAGDIIDGNRSNDLIRERIYGEFCKKYKNVIAVLGNHDYAGTYPHSIEQKIKYGFSNLHVLDNNSVIIDNQRFIGGTLWYSDCHDHFLKQDWFDYRYIKRFEPWVYRKNNDFIEKVAKKMKSDDIVISHMLPSKLSIHPYFYNSLQNTFFLNDIEEYIIKNQPKLYIHGHTHYPFDYKIGDTRVYCNPLAYPSEHTNNDFLNRMAIDI